MRTPSRAIFAGLDLTAYMRDLKPDKLSEFARFAGLDPARHSVTGRTLRHTPPIQSPGPARGPRPDLVIIDDPILLPHQKMVLEEARAWWADMSKGRK